MNNILKSEIRIAVLSCTGPTKAQMDLLSDLRQEYAGCSCDFDKDLDEISKSCSSTQTMQALRVPIWYDITQQ